MNIAWRLMTLGVGAGAGFVAKNLVDVVWEKALGKRKPTGDGDDLDQSFFEVLVFSGVTAMVTAMTAEAVRRASEKAYGRRTARIENAAREERA